MKSEGPLNITVVVPTYNEAGNIGVLAAELLALPLPGLRLLIVDDASPDGTGRLADKLAAASYGRMAVLHRTGLRGLGLAYKDGFCRAIEQGADIVVQMDADFSHAPVDVLRLVEELADCDVVVGSRYVPGGQVDYRWGLNRRALSRSANILSRTILGLETRDATAGFKAWRRSALEAIDVRRIRANGYLFQEEMVYLSERLGLRIREIPIFFADRQTGRSKMSTKTKFEAALGLISLRRRYRKVRALAVLAPE